VGKSLKPDRALSVHLLIFVYRYDSSKEMANYCSRLLYLSIAIPKTIELAVQALLFVYNKEKAQKTSKKGVK
jgi:hypothetical protein